MYITDKAYSREDILSCEKRSAAPRSESTPPSSPRRAPSTPRQPPPAARATKPSPLLAPSRAPHREPRRFLNVLGFQLTQPNALVFLRRFAKVAGLTAPPERVARAGGARTAPPSPSATEHLASYLVELTLQDYEMLKYLPSIVCASAIFLALSPQHGRRPWVRPVSTPAYLQPSTPAPGPRPPARARARALSPRPRPCPPRARRWARAAPRPSFLCGASVSVSARWAPVADSGAREAHDVPGGRPALVRARHLRAAQTGGHQQPAGRAQEVRAGEVQRRDQHRPGATLAGLCHWLE